MQQGARGGRPGMGGGMPGMPALGPGGMPDLSKLSPGQMAQMQVRFYPSSSALSLRAVADSSIFSSLLALTLHHRFLRLVASPSPSSSTPPLLDPLLYHPLSLAFPPTEYASSGSTRTDVSAGRDAANSADDVGLGRWRRRATGDGRDGRNARHEQADGHVWRWSTVVTRASHINERKSAPRSLSERCS